MCSIKSDNQIKWHETMGGQHDRRELSYRDGTLIFGLQAISILSIVYCLFSFWWKAKFQWVRHMKPVGGQSPHRMNVLLSQLPKTKSNLGTTIRFGDPNEKQKMINGARIPWKSSPKSRHATITHSFNILYPVEKKQKNDWRYPDPLKAILLTHSQVSGRFSISESRTSYSFSQFHRVQKHLMTLLGPFLYCGFHW